MKRVYRVTCKRCNCKVSKHKTLGTTQLGFVCTPWRSLDGRLINCRKPEGV